MSNDVSIDDVVTGPKPSAPHIVSVVPSSGHRLLLEYETGEKKLFDVTPYIKGDFFGKLEDESYFQQVRILFDGWFVGWPEGQDMASDEMYDRGVLVA